MAQYVIYLLILVAFFLIEIKSCPPLHDPDNGMVYIFGKDAIFTCKSGFTILGNSHLECTNGEWSSPLPKCQAA